MSKKIEYRCDDCGTDGVKLWRVYNIVADMTPLRCLACAERNQGEKLDGDKIGCLIPAVPTEDGTTFWGYTSVPSEAVLWWHNQPVDKADAYGPLGVDDVN